MWKSTCLNIITSLNGFKSPHLPWHLLVPSMYPAGHHQHFHSTYTYQALLPKHNSKKSAESMNLFLQDPFTVAKEYPDTLVQTFQYGHSVTIEFNRKGDYLASGLSNGAIAIYDLVSNGMVALLSQGGHTRPVTSLKWSHCGQYILSASQDWCCIVWDLSKINTESFDGNPAILHKIRFNSAIWQALFHPHNHQVFIASIFDDDPVYVDYSSGEAVVTRLQTDPVVRGDDEDDDPKKRDAKHRTLVTSFTPQGHYVVTGTSKGWINIISTEDFQTVHLVKVTNSNIKTLEISPNGRKLAVNSSDRIIRQINLPDMLNNQDPEQWEFDIEHRYQDVVNRLQWNTVAFNHNLEFLVASTFGQSSQDLYVWETSMGSLIKILEGSHEELIDVKWNYSKCMIGSTGLDSGTVYLWLVQFPLKWSALAPDFVEIEENEEYEEKEDEFDVIDETDLIRKRMEEEDTDVDITTRETTDARGFDAQVESFVIPINYEKTLQR